MAVFGKKNESATHAEESDFVRIPPGTRIAANGDGKLTMSFAGDMSFGEAIPDLSELASGRNLSIDAGVLSAIDEQAARHKLTRSAFVELMARRALPGMG